MANSRCRGAVGRLLSALRSASPAALRSAHCARRNSRRGDGRGTVAAARSCAGRVSPSNYGCMSCSYNCIYDII